MYPVLDSHWMRTFAARLLLCYPVSWVLTATVFSITYFRGNWLNKRMETNN